jgi:GWxTD domain-containing protein
MYHGQSGVVPIQKESAMKRCHLIFGPRLFGIALVLVWAASRSAFPGGKTVQDSSAKEFYEKARLIMTSEEEKVWKALPDDAAKEEFIEEFWKVRDPDPGTDENEAKLEFEERVRYANMWFGAYNARRGLESKNEDEEKSRSGWNEERGRVYIILGPPDVLYFQDENDESVSYDASRMRPKAEDWKLEQWVYDRYRSYVVFTKTSGGSWRMENYDPHFFEVLEWAKLNWISSDFTEDVKRRFRFKPEFSPAGFLITVPVSRVNFDENFKAEFGIKINVYLNRAKVDTVEETKVVQENEEALLNKKNLAFEIAYSMDKKGEYLFDFIIQDKLAPGPSKYRSFLKRKV